MPAATSPSHLHPPLVRRWPQAHARPRCGSVPTGKVAVESGWREDLRLFLWAWAIGFLFFLVWIG